MTTPDGPDHDISAGLVIRPGDTLVVALRDIHSHEGLGRLKEQLHERLPNIEVIVLAGVNQLAVYRPEEASGG